MYLEIQIAYKSNPKEELIPNKYEYSYHKL